MAKRKRKIFSADKEVKAIARERVGTVKAGAVMMPKSDRKPKYPADDIRNPDSAGNGATNENSSVHFARGCKLHFAQARTTNLRRGLPRCRETAIRRGLRQAGGYLHVRAAWRRCRWTRHQRSRPTHYPAHGPLDAAYDSLRPLGRPGFRPGLDEKYVINNGFAITATMPSTTTKEEYCGMLRNLLTDRFHLCTLRHEMQPRPGFELTVLPGGPKFKKYDPQDPGPEEMPGTRRDKNGFPLLSPAQATALAFSMSPTGLTKESFRNDMAHFARGLGDSINQSNGLGTNAPLPRVVDKTGLTGVYDIRFEYAGTPINLPQARDAGAGPAAAPDPADVGPSIFYALQQLGLRLQKANDVRVEVLIVEHADQTPAEN